MTVQKLTYPSKENAVQEKINEIIDNLGGGGGGSTYTAGDGIDITNNVISVDGTQVSEVELATVATSGDYDDLINKPTIPAAQVNSDWNANSGVAQILNKPTIPTVNNATLTITQGGTTKGMFTANASSDVTIALDGSSGGSSRNIGEIVQSTVPLTDAGLHLLDGSLISGSGSYADFVTYIAGLVSGYSDLFDTEANWQTSVSTYGVCGKFVYDSVNNTVRLPKITGFVEGTITPTTLGDLTEAGLPNITGSVLNENGNNCYAGQAATTGSGALKVELGTNQKALSVGSGRGAYNRGFSLDASDSSPIYGNSSTVQPQSIKVLYYIVMANTTKTNIEVDIDQIATDLNGKADVDFSNVNNSGTSLSAGWSMPSNTYDDLTLGASGTTYTAPSNGCFTINKLVSSSSQYVRMVNTTNGINIVIFNPNSSGNVRANISAKKGDIIEVGYNAGGTLQWFRFVYAKGSESEA